MDFPDAVFCVRAEDCRRYRFAVKNAGNTVFFNSIGNSSGFPIELKTMMRRVCPSEARVLVRMENVTRKKRVRCGKLTDGILSRLQKRRKTMTKKQKKLLIFISAFAAVFAVVPEVNAMHIMEGYLPIGFCIAWGIVCIPFLTGGFFSIQKKLKENRKNITILAMSGAFIFVISSLKIPSVTGSCSHMTGTGLGAILFGPGAVSILGIIVLVFQAVLLAHGGLTSLGANTFSMAIAGPVLSWGVYGLCRKCKVNRRVSVFLAAALGDLFTYCVTSFQLALAYPSEQGGILASAGKFLGVFAPTQLPLALIEGFLTTVIIITLENYARPELESVGYLEKGKAGREKIQEG